jgi:hypothetical protein
MAITLKNFVYTAADLALEADRNFVYPKRYDYVKQAEVCDYVRQSEASCLIGSVVAQLGVDIAHFHALEGNGSTVFLNRLKNEGFLVFEGTDEEWNKLQQFASYLQSYQDSTMTWKDAFIKASKFLV